MWAAWRLKAMNRAFAIAALAAIGFYNVACSYRVGENDFSKIRVGMTEWEVRAQLGPPQLVREEAGAHVLGYESYRRWLTDLSDQTLGRWDQQIVLVKLANGKVESVTNGLPTQTASMQRIGSDDAECQSYGAEPGTQAYIQCRMAKDQQRQQAKAALATAILSNTSPPYTVPMPAPPPPAQRPINCTSSPLGTSVSTTCY